jgi:hypothetical protein
MKTRTAVVVVLVMGVVLALGFLVVLGVGRLAQKVRAGLASETARQEFVSRWRPPASFAPERVFPATVQGRTVSAVETNPVLTDPALDLPGFRAVYAGGEGVSAIEVFVGQPRPMEAEAIRQRTREAFASRGGATSVVQMNDRLRLTRSQPPATVEIWELQGWLFFFRSEADIPAAFIRDYLTALAAPARP